MVELDKFLAFLALIVGGVLGNFLLKPTFNLEQKLFVLCVMFAYAFLLSWSNCLLERLEEEMWRKNVLALFGEEE